VAISGSSSLLNPELGTDLNSSFGAAGKSSLLYEEGMFSFLTSGSVLAGFKIAVGETDRLRVPIIS